MEVFRSIVRRRSAAIAICVLASAVVSEQARAEDGPPNLADAIPAAVDGPASVVESVVVPILDATVVPASVPVPAPDSPEPVASPEAVAAETAPAHPGDTTAQTADTTSNTSGEHAGKTMPRAPSPDAPKLPANVNIAVRIDSAGDNGPVTQVNVAVATGDGGTAASPVASTKPASVRAGVGSAEPASGGVERDSSAEAEPILDDASCGVVSTSPSQVSEQEASGIAIPDLWNCLFNSSTMSLPSVQYLDAIIWQYRPVNINVSIRVRSPGNDGSVTQVNAAIAVGAARLSPAVSPGSAPYEAVLPVVVDISTFGGTTAAEIGENTAPTFEISSGITGVTEEAAVTTGADEGLAAALAGDLSGRRSVVFLGPGTTGVSDASGISPRLPFAPPIPSAVGRSAAVSTAALSELGRRTGADDLGARESSVDRRGPAVRPRASDPTRSVVILDGAPAGATVAPAGGGGSSSGGLPLYLLALPVLAAMLGPARRIPLDLGRWRSEHRARTPDTPG